MSQSPIEVFTGFQPQFIDPETISKEILQNKLLNNLSEENTLNQILSYIESYNKKYYKYGTLIYFLITQNRADLIKCIPQKYYGKPDWWFKNGNTIQMISIHYNCMDLLPKQLYSRINQQNCSGYNCTMIATLCGKLHIYPEELWCLNTDKSKDNETVAMLYVKTYNQHIDNGLIQYFDLPQYFYHDPLLKNIDGNTIAMLSVICNCYTVLPKEFVHDNSIKNNKGQSLKDLVESYYNNN